jgi:hypothetical protein
MPETPFQFRYQGQVAGLRTAAASTELAEVTPAVEPEGPRRSRRGAWGWLAVLCVLVVVAASWWAGIDARSIHPAEISLAVDRVPAPGETTSAASRVSEGGAGAATAGDGRSYQSSRVQVMVDPVLRTAETAARAQQVVAPSHGPSASASRSRAAEKPLPAKPRDVRFDLSIVKVRYLDGRLAPTVITALSAALPAIRSCITPILQVQPDLRGTVTATVSARDGKISAVNVESGIRHTSLRFCFRQALMSRPVSAGAEEPAFDARVEFFLLPRVR